MPTPLDASRSSARETGSALPRVLIVSPHFPPSTLAGVHRARHLAKHLPASGWQPIVIRAGESHYTEAGDPALAALVPDAVEQIRTSAIPASVSRLIGVGDIGIRAYKPIERAIAMAIRQHTPQAILITGSPYYPMLLARWIKAQWNIPVVLDFQDPWVSADGARKSRWSKGGLAHRLALFLEPRAVRHAAWITSVSENQNTEMADRYAWLARDRMSAIPIGGDPDDFVALRDRPPAGMTVNLEPGRTNICYVGTFLPRAEPVVRTLFEAAALLSRESPELVANLRFVFVGTSNQPAGTVNSAHRVLPVAAAAGVADLVEEHPARVPFLEALAILAKARGLVLLGSDEPHYTASKIYPALMSGRPYLSIFHAASSSHDILSQAGGGATFAFENARELAALAPAIARGLATLVKSPESLGRPNPEAYAPFTAHAIARRFADVFDAVSARRAAADTRAQTASPGPTGRE